jgi:hypothetical protein
MPNVDIRFNLNFRLGGASYNDRRNKDGCSLGQTSKYAVDRQFLNYAVKVVPSFSSPRPRV